MYLPSWALCGLAAFTCCHSPAPHHAVEGVGVNRSTCLRGRFSPQCASAPTVVVFVNKSPLDTQRRGSVPALSCCRHSRAGFYCEHLFVSSGKMAERAIVGSHVKSMCDFVRNCHTGVQNGCTFHIPPASLCTPMSGAVTDGRANPAVPVPSLQTCE